MVRTLELWIISSEKNAQSCINQMSQVPKNCCMKTCKSKGVCHTIMALPFTFLKVF